MMTQDLTEAREPPMHCMNEADGSHLQHLKCRSGVHFF